MLHRKDDMLHRKEDMLHYELRAHHALCTGFFCGHGYSTDFVENMAAFVVALRASDPILTLRCVADGLCARCPHNRGGFCEDLEKVSRYDAAALRLLDLADGATLRYSALAALVRERVIASGRLSEVCGDCRWYALCSSAEYCAITP